MKYLSAIAFFLISFSTNAQINLVEHFGNVFALGNSIVVKNDTIHITGTTGLDLGSNQFTPSAFIAGFDLSGNLQYYEQVGDTGRVYEGEKLLIDSFGNKYILGDFKRDSLGSSTNQGVFVQKRAPNNQILWTTEYQDSLSNAFYFLRDGVLLENGNIALCGAYNLSGPFEKDILFMVFDSLGAVIVHKQIGVSGIQEEAKSMCSYDQGRIIIGARKFDPPDDRNWVLMLDYQGNVLKDYVSSSNKRPGVWDIVKTQDGGVACASTASDGDVSTPEYKIHVEKLDSSLNQVWDYTNDYFFSSWNLSTSIAEAENGEIVVGGNYGAYEGVNDTIGYDAFLIKLSPIGDSLWHKGYYHYDKITWSEKHNMYDLSINNDRIYFVGDANDFNVAPPPGQSLWLVSTDSNGVVSNLDERVSYDQNIMVYPNPARERITMVLDKSDPVRGLISVFNLQGQMVKSIGFDHAEVSIDISTLQPSLYILHIQTEQKSHTIRFVKE